MVARDYPPDIGGVATNTEALVTHLTALGVDVQVFATHSDFRTALLPFRRSFHGSEFDIIHFQSAPHAAFARRHPLVITLTSPVMEEGKYYKLGNKLKLPVASALEWYSLRKADAVIVQSRINIGELQYRYRFAVGKSHLIPCGVEYESFTPRKGSENEPARILICSRLDPRKNIAESLIALANVSAPYELTVIGAGPDREKLERLARDLSVHANFLGAVPQKTLEEAYRASDIFLSSSRSEGFGISVLQGLAAGCAVVASGIPAHRELVANMNTGIVYDRPDELSRALGALLEDRGLVRRLGTNARAKSLSYSWKSIAQETLALYLAVLAGQPSSLIAS